MIEGSDHPATPSKSAPIVETAVTEVGVPRALAEAFTEEQMPQSTCRLCRTGSSTNEVVEHLIKDGLLSRRQAQALIFLSVLFYCREYESTWW